MFYDYMIKLQMKGSSHGIHYYFIAKTIQCFKWKEMKPLRQCFLNFKL